MRTMKIILFIIAILLAACGCQPVAYTPPSTTSPEPVKVAVVGDSITEWSTAAISAELSDYSRHVRGIGGIKLAEGRTELVLPAVASDPDVLVVELGINSAMAGWPDGSDLYDLERLLADISEVPCVIWVTPDVENVSPVWWDAAGPGTLHERLEAFEASLLKRLPRFPNVHHADWGEVQRLDGHGFLFHEDNLHPSPAGQQALAEYIHHTIGAFC